MVKFDIAAFADTAMKDPEFKREIRYFDGRLKLGVADTDYALEFNDGALVKASEGPVPDADCKIYVKGDEDHWREILAEFPKPFFQCVQSANIKHGLQISASDVTFAYLPALNRMVSLLRLAQKEA